MGRLGLRGRDPERELLDALLTDVRGGASRVLVVRGEAGIGKSALLDYLMAGASGCRVARVCGVESEAELAFAGLHQLCAPFLNRLDTLPVPQRDALGTAFGLSSDAEPDRFRVGLAVLTLLADVADKQPLVCVVDDAQWLDHASLQTLAFVARRLVAESVALVFAVRMPLGAEPLDGLPESRLTGLAETEARALLRSGVAGPMDDRVRDRIVAESHGNPLALLELPHVLSPEELGGFGVPGTPALAGRIEDGFRRRLGPLPTDTRLLLLVAAAEPLGDPVLVLRAAGQLGVDVQAADPAAEAGLVDVAGHLRFRHPLVRSAVYRAATQAERRKVHGALAEATDAETDTDRWIWHRAHAADGTDDAVADELERAAERAYARGGLAAAAAFLEESVRLTAGPADRARRALAAARARQRAGSPDGARSLLDLARTMPLDALQQAQAALIEAQLAFVTRRGSDAPQLLLAAAKQFEPMDVVLSRRTYLDALGAAVSAGRLAGDLTLTELARAACAAPPPGTARRAPDLLLDGLGVLASQGRRAAVPLLREAVAGFRGDDVSTEEALRWLWLAGRVADDLRDDDGWHALVTRQVELARQAGALTVLPVALRARMVVHVVSGELKEAEALEHSVRSLMEATGTRLAPYGAVALAAWRGDEALTAELTEATIADATRRGEGMGLSISYNGRAVLNNGYGRYPEALEAAERGCEFDDLGVYAWTLPELVEAATRMGRLDAAAAAAGKLSEIADLTGSELARGVAARCQALVGDDEELFREAIDRLGRTRIRVELARAHLTFGESLRRRGRRADAREQLHVAHQLYGDMGAEAFADRARRELLATGETVRRRSVETHDELTAQEALIARLAGEGRTNPEIAAELYISPRTVEWHLRKVFGKLGISSRRELRARALRH